VASLSSVLIRAVPYAQLLEVVVTLCRSFVVTPGAKEGEESISSEGAGQEDHARAAPQWPSREEDVRALGALLQLLQPSYGGTLSGEERACLRLMLLLDALIAAHWVGGWRTAAAAASCTAAHASR
jgi:hypothetical protein